jgi:hypothetical protein
MPARTPGEPDDTERVLSGSGGGVVSSVFRRLASYLTSEPRKAGHARMRTAGEGP